MLNGYKIIPTILNITSKALSKVGLSIKIATSILSFLSTSALIVADLSIGKLVAYGLGKVFGVEEKYEKRYFWSSKKSLIIYITF